MEKSKIKIKENSSNKLVYFIKNRARLFIVFVFIFPVLIFSGCTKEKNPAYKTDLEIWGVFDSSESLERIMSEYRKINPHVGEIKYRKFTVDSYKNDLIDALASGQGPDIFWINNSWGPSFRDKTEPAPEWLSNEKEFTDNFVDVAAQDFLIDRKIYAVPLSVDSLALYYNKDIFNAVGITKPPATWEEFSEAVRKITRVDQNDNITQAGAAIGTAENINRSTDVLGLLMFQNGAKMISDSGAEATFDRVVNLGGKSVRAGENALEFYSQFARRNLSIYTWNPRMHYSIDSFYEGTTGMMINYSWHYSTIKNKNSKLNFAVAPVPQIDPEHPVNYANYWAMAVSKNKLLNDSQKKKIQENGLNEGNYNKVRVYESWQLLKYLTFKNNGSVTLYNSINGNKASFPTQVDPAGMYLSDTMKPAARKDLIEKQKNDPFLSPFAFGNLAAKSWQQKDPEAVEEILTQSIGSVNRGQATVYEALRLAAERVTQTMRK